MYEFNTIEKAIYKSKIINQTNTILTLADFGIYADIAGENTIIYFKPINFLNHSINNRHLCVCKINYQGVYCIGFFAFKEDGLYIWQDETLGKVNRVANLLSTLEQSTPPGSYFFANQTDDLNTHKLTIQQVNIYNKALGLIFDDSKYQNNNQTPKLNHFYKISNNTWDNVVWRTHSVYDTIVNQGFYSNSVIVIDLDGQRLTLDLDYKFSFYHDELSTKLNTSVHFGISFNKRTLNKGVIIKYKPVLTDTSEPLYTNTQFDLLSQYNKSNPVLTTLDVAMSSITNVNKVKNINIKDRTQTTNVFSNLGLQGYTL